VTLREVDGATFADGGGWHMALDADAAGRLRRVARSDRVILGFRPEHVELIEPSAADDLDDSLVGRVVWTEMRGDSHVVMLVPIQSRADRPGMQEEQVTIEVQNTLPPHIGEPLAIRIRHDLLNLFDPQTGTNLLPVAS
jgi:hypothetical protein